MPVNGNVLRRFVVHDNVQGVAFGGRNEWARRDTINEPRCLVLTVTSSDALGDSQRIRDRRSLREGKGRGDGSRERETHNAERKEVEDGKRAWKMEGRVSDL